jgi:hypothetical protein
MPDAAKKFERSVQSSVAHNGSDEGVEGGDGASMKKIKSRFDEYESRWYGACFERYGLRGSDEASRAISQAVGGMARVPIVFPGWIGA